jgi:hypothetical protein
MWGPPYRLLPSPGPAPRASHLLSRRLRCGSLPAWGPPPRRRPVVSSSPAVLCGGRWPGGAVPPAGFLPDVRVVPLADTSSSPASLGLLPPSLYAARVLGMSGAASLPSSKRAKPLLRHAACSSALCLESQRCGEEEVRHRRGRPGRVGVSGLGWRGEWSGSGERNKKRKTDMWAIAMSLSTSAATVAKPPSKTARRII